MSSGLFLWLTPTCMSNFYLLMESWDYYSDIGVVNCNAVSVCVMRDYYMYTILKGDKYVVDYVYCNV